MMKRLKSLDQDIRKHFIGVIVFILVAVILQFVGLDSYINRILNLGLIYVVVSLSMNLVNGFTGMFSLGQAGFMAIGAYAMAVLTMSADLKEKYYLIEPVFPILKQIQLPYLVALLLAGLITAFIGFLIALPVLRLTDDYLAIATLGFAEIILVFIRTQFRITNGALGLKGIPQHENLLLTAALTLVVIIFMIFLTRSSYGKALIAIRDDEIAAQAIGINIFRHKVVSFSISSFLAGIGGGMLAALVGTISPVQFQFVLTFNVLLIVVLGGMGRIWGNVIAAIVVTGMLEYLRILDEPINFLFIKTDDGLPGLRMVVFSILLMVIVIFRRPDRRFLEPAREKVAQSIKSLLTKKNGGTPDASN